MIKYLGTHNSGTSSKLVWWQRPFGYLLNLTSRCQKLSIEDQLKNFVRIFNIQVTYYKNEWVFSHGICIYTGKLLDAIEKMKQYAIPESPVYFQLFLDKNFLLGQNKEEFRKMVKNLNNELKDTNVHMLYAYIEGTDEYPYRSNIELNASEHYWTTSWAVANAKSWIDKIPLPKRHAKIYNDTYVEENKADYLMLDFIEIGNHFINGNNKTTTTTSSNMPVTTTWEPTTTTTVNPIYATVIPVTFKINNVTYKSGISLQINKGTKITLSCLTDSADIYYSINGGKQCLYTRPISIYNSCTIDAYAIKATDYINHIYYGPSDHTNITLNVVSATSTFIPTTTTSSNYPVTTTTWYPTSTTSNMPIYHTWLPVLFKSSDGKQKSGVSIIGICDKETITVNQLPSTKTFEYNSNEKVTFTCDDNGTLYYRKKDSTTAIKVGNKEFNFDELYNLVIIYKEKSILTTTTSIYPITTTTTEVGRLEMIVDNQKYLFKNGLNFSLTLNVGESKMIMFDTINGYPIPNNMIALSDNNKIALSSLSMFYRNITISGVDVGQTAIRIATTYRDVYYEGYITVEVIDA